MCNVFSYSHVVVFPEFFSVKFQRRKQDAVALSYISFKSKYKKNRALGDKNHRFVPFFGSSEWSRFDSMHPSVLADAYQREYTPYLLGQRGAASLTQYFGMQQIGAHLKIVRLSMLFLLNGFHPKGHHLRHLNNILVVIKPLIFCKQVLRMTMIDMQQSVS